MDHSDCLDDKDEFYDTGFMWGEPGLGKTAAVKELCPNALELKMSEINIADICGLPVVPHKGGANGLR